MARKWQNKFNLLLLYFRQFPCCYFNSSMKKKHQYYVCVYICILVFFLNYATLLQLYKNKPFHFTKTQDLDITYKVSSDQGGNFQRLSDHQRHQHQHQPRKMSVPSSTMERLFSPFSYEDTSYFLRFVTDMLSIWLKEIWLMTRDSSVQQSICFTQKAG